MNGFTKLFGNSLLTSTLWREDPVICKIWITMLSLADADGIVDATIPGIAHAAYLEVADVEHALAKFQTPDKYSRSQVKEGRRIEAVDGGWLLVNYDHYRHKHTPEDRREYERIRKREYRERLAPDVPDVPNVPQCLVKSRKAEAEADTEAEYLSSNSNPKSNLPLKSRSETKETKNGVGFAVGVLTKLKIPSSPTLLRLVGDSIDFRMDQTGNPVESECDFIIAQYREWEASPAGRHNPRMGPTTWFQGKHYNDDPKTWQQENGRDRQANDTSHMTVLNE